MAHRVGTDPVAYNKSLAEANNRLLLLNIARASKNHPVYFTEVGEVNESLTTSATLGGAIPWLNPANSAGTLINPSASAGSEAAFKVSPLASKEFFSGLTKQVTPELFQYFWDQGWPRQLLLALLVREVVIKRKVPAQDEKPRSLVGAFDYFGPTPTAQYELYRAFTDAYGAGSLTFEVSKEVAPEKDNPRIGPALAPKPDEPDTIRSLFEADKAGYKIRLEQGADAGRYGLYLAKAEARAVGGPVPAILLEPTATAQALRSALGSDLQRGQKRVGIDDVEVEVELFLRSPEAVLYHLGEIVRAERTLGYQVMIDRHGRKLPLFTSRGTGACGVSVEYCCETYCVGGDPRTDESMHVLSFLNQLIMLHKGAEKPPTSSFVRVLGGR